MLEAQVENDAFFSPHMGQVRNSRRNLQSSIEIGCPANPRTDVEILPPLRRVGAPLFDSLEVHSVSWDIPECTILSGTYVSFVVWYVLTKRL
jgi:hypothetical protein